MKIKSLVFLFLFAVLPLSFSANSTNEGSGPSLNPPVLVFKSWRVGRSPTGTDMKNKEQLSFITTSETACWLQASVVYQGGNQPKNTAPIDPKTVKWEFPTSDLNKGWKVEPPGTSWSGSHPSKLSASTSFNVLVKFTLPKYNDTNYYTLSASCSANDKNRRARSPKHRSGEKMKITVKFSAKTTQGDKIELTLPLLQDEIDQLRQEYLDLTRKIPSRGAIKDVDGDFNNFGKVFYDFGHYDVMLYEDLKDKHGAWTERTNKIYRQPNNKTDFTRSDLFVTSGFRNPHHNDHHARKTTKRATDTLHGLHQYGLALDVSGKEFDVDGDGSYDDQQKMRDAAENASPPAKKTFKYSTGHVHADWRGSGWPPSNPIPPAPKFSLLEQSTDKPLVVEKKLLGCGHPNDGGWQHFQTSNYQQPTPQQPIPEPPKPKPPAQPEPDDDDTTPVDTHTHKYPAEMRQCGSHLKSEGGAHSFDRCSHCGRGYWACSQWAYRHTDAATCRRPGCGVTFYRCSNGTCTSKWGTKSSHWAR